MTDLALAPTATGCAQGGSELKLSGKSRRASSTGRPKPCRRKCFYPRSISSVRFRSARNNKPPLPVMAENREWPAAGS